MMGIPQPYLATVLSKLLGLLTIPMNIVENKELFTSESIGREKGGKSGLDLFFEIANGQVLIFVYIAICTGAGGYIKRFYFGCLGANSTYAIRDLMYKEILKKNMGWFDQRENSSGTLLSAMAQDSTIINGVSAESLGPAFQGGFAVVGGIAFAFYYCW